jgi:hypothetical protein
MGGTASIRNGTVCNGWDFGHRITLFKLFGFDIRLDASWLIVVARVTWSLVGILEGYAPRLP